MLIAPTRWMAENRMERLAAEEPNAGFRVESRLGAWAVVRRSVEMGMPGDIEGLDGTMTFDADPPF